MQEEQMQSEMQQQPTEVNASVKEPSKKKGGKLLIVFLVILGVVGISLGGLFLYAKQTPQYSLYLMTKAVENKDYKEFTKYFNVEAVIDDLMEKVIEESREKMDDQNMEYFDDLVLQMKDQMKEQSEAEIKKQVEEGKFYSDFRGALFTSFLNTTVTIKGNEAEVVVVDKKENKTLPLKMRKKGNYWEVYKIDAGISELQNLMQ